MKDSIMRRPIDPKILELMLAALPNVAFDGWSNSTFVAACKEADISEEKARLFCPRGQNSLAFSSEISASLHAATNVEFDQPSNATFGNAANISSNILGSIGLRIIESFTRQLYL